MPRGARVVAAAAWLLWGCAGEPTLPEGTLDPVRVGLITSLTGGLSSLGPGWKNAALLAEQEANAAGGVLPGRPLELIVADDRTIPEAGRQAAEELLAEGVVAVIGAASSSVSLAVAEVTEPAGVPQVSCCSTSPLLTNAQGAGDRYLFRTVPSDELQAAVLVQTAFDTFLCRRLAVMHLDDDYGVPFGEAISQRFTGRGGEVVVRVAFADERASYVDEVNTVVAAAPDCVAMVGFPASAGAILRDWNDLPSPPDVTWIGTDGVRADAFVRAAGNPAYVDGFVGTAPREQVGARRDVFVQRYRVTFADDPVIFGASQYDAAALLALAIARAGDANGAAIRDALYEVSRPNTADDDMVVQPGQLREGIQAVRNGTDVDYDGAGGAVDLDEYGNVRGDYEVWEYDAAASAFQTIGIVRAEEIDP